MFVPAIVERVIPRPDREMSALQTQRSKGRRASSERCDTRIDNTVRHAHGRGPPAANAKHERPKMRRRRSCFEIENHVSLAQTYAQDT